MYPLLRSLLFCFDPERVHHFSMRMLQRMCSKAWMRTMIRKNATPSAARVQIGNLTFPNTIGLAAGFDKNAEYLLSLSALGFGFVEIGTVTPLPQDGNEKPRLFRLPKDKALINRMGFNNHGVEVVKRNLEIFRNSYGKNDPMIIGGNIGKNKITPNEDAWKDYLTCFRTLYNVVDYFTVNVSSPNTPGLRDLQSIPALEKILGSLLDQRKQYQTRKPIFLKVAPDMNEEELKNIVELALRINLDGLILANTTTSRSNLKTDKKKVERIGAGGVSGLPLKQRANEMLLQARHYSNNQLTLIGSGGIFNAADAKQRMDSGAKLVQVYTGFIYEGPFIVKKIQNSL